MNRHGGGSGVRRLLEVYTAGSARPVRAKPGIGIVTRFASPLPSRRTAVLLSVALVAAAGLVSALFVGPAAASVDASERIIGTTEVDPGDAVDVTIETTLASGGDRLVISDDFSPAFGNVEITATSINGERTLPVIAATNESFIEVGFQENFQAGDTITVVYEVTVPSDAENGQLFAFDGEAALDDTEPVAHTGEGQISVGEADVSVTGYDLDSTELAVGETLTVEATVANGRDEPANTDVSLLIDGSAETTKNVGVGAGESTTVEFRTTYNAAGEYEVTVNDLKTTTVAVSGDSSNGNGSTPTIATSPVTESGETPTDGSSTEPTATPSPTDGSAGDPATATPNESPMGSFEDMPGFGAPLTAVALLAATIALLARRRSRP